MSVSVCLSVCLVSVHVCEGVCVCVSVCLSVCLVSVHVCAGCSDERDLLTFDELNGDEGLSVDEALRLGLSPLDLNDIGLLTSDLLTSDSTELFADSVAEEQLRLDQPVVPTSSNYYRPF